MSAHRFALAIADIAPCERYGVVERVLPGHVTASGPLATLGDLCEIVATDGSRALAEVASVEKGSIRLVPLDPTARIATGASVRWRPGMSAAPVGDGFGGRAIDAMGTPIDDGVAILPDDRWPLSGVVLAPMARQEPQRILETGLRTIDGLLTLGVGQRIGIFSASGVGKTSLVRQIAAHTACDRCILCLVGERGHEVEYAWRDLSGLGKRVALVAATSDQSAPLRARAVQQALCLAEYWRSKGQHVLIVVDSLTRLAMALREIGLAAGAPPALRGYTPNVFAALPRVIERCGADKQGGAISAVMSVLCESDDADDPIVETMKSLLDGHIVLSRALAERGQFPAIDVLRSVSRQSTHLMSAAHRSAARTIIAQVAAYEDARIMIDSGIYKTGASAEIDTAIKNKQPILAYLKQEQDSRTPLPTTLQQLQLLAQGPHG